MFHFNRNRLQREEIDVTPIKRRDDVNNCLTCRLFTECNHSKKAFNFVCKDFAERKEIVFPVYSG